MSFHSSTLRNRICSESPSTLPRIVLSSVALATLLALSTDARADDTPAKKVPAPTNTTAARIDDSATSPATPSPQVDKVEKADDDADLKRIAIELNPLAIAIGRYSIQGEYLFARHHGVVLNPFYAHVPVEVTVNGQSIDAGSLDGFGGELGYRFYTGNKGPNGFYVGPSVIVASYTQSAASGTAAAGTNGSDSFASYGGALDIGGQAVIGPGVVIGGGFGLQYTQNSRDIATDNLNLASAIIAGGGVRPRFNLSAGYAF